MKFSVDWSHGGTIRGSKQEVWPLAVQKIGRQKVNAAAVFWLWIGQDNQLLWSHNYPSVIPVCDPWLLETQCLNGFFFILQCNKLVIFIIELCYCCIYKFLFLYLYWMQICVHENYELLVIMRTKTRTAFLIMIFKYPSII